MDNRYKDRKTLKSYFQRGNSPTEDQFAELIDSVTNIHEDGKVTATASDGMRLFTTGKSGVVATVFTDDPDKGGSEPLWRMALDGNNGLRIQDGKGETVLTIDRDRNVTVEGTLKAARYLSGKDGKEEAPDSNILKIKGDGLWHDLPVEDAVGQPADGCRVYRLSVCYLNRHSRAYSACEAVASHSGGRQCRVHSSRRHWWGWSGRVKIRWQRTDGKIRLQMRSRWTESGAETIYCRIEILWEL